MSIRNHQYYLQHKHVIGSHITNVASSEQKGKAAEYRTRVKDIKLRNDLNAIVHSSDEPNSPFGKKFNRFRDYSNSYSRDAQNVLDYARNKIEFKRGKRIII